MAHPDQFWWIIRQSDGAHLTGLVGDDPVWGAQPEAMRVTDWALAESLIEKLGGQQEFKMVKVAPLAG